MYLQGQCVASDLLASQLLGLSWCCLLLARQLPALGSRQQVLHCCCWASMQILVSQYSAIRREDAGGYSRSNLLTLWVLECAQVTLEWLRRCVRETPSLRMQVSWGDISCVAGRELARSVAYLTIASTKCKLYLVAGDKSCNRHTHTQVVFIRVPSRCATIGKGVHMLTAVPDPQL